MTTNDQDLALLGKVAMAAAVAGAKDYLRAHGLTINPAEKEQFLADLEDAICETGPDAVQDALDAAEAGMYEVAQATYIASFRNAGIATVEKYAAPCVN